MRNKIIIVVLMTAILLSCTYIAVASNHDIESKANPVVKYIGGSNLTNSYQWTNFLNNHCYVDAEMVRADKADTFDFSSTDLIMIGYDTESNWTDMTLVHALKHADKPIFAIGHGGYQFLWKAGMGSDGCGVTNPAKQNSKVVDPTNSLFNVPNVISIPVNNTLTVQDKSILAIFLYKPSLPGNVTVLMLDPADNNYATMTYEANYTFFWGFDTTDPYHLASHGYLLLLNGMYFCRTHFIPRISEFGLVMPTVISVAAITCFCIFRRRKD